MTIRFLILILCGNFALFSQESRPISTAFPFLLIPPDAIAAASADAVTARQPNILPNITTPQNMFFPKKNGASD